MWTKFNIKLKQNFFKCHNKVYKNYNKWKLTKVKKKTNLISNVSYIIKIKKPMNKIFKIRYLDDYILG